MQATVTLDDLEEFILERLPRMLERDPRFVTFIEGIVSESFPGRDEVARLLDEAQQHRKETAELSEQVDNRFEQVDERLVQIERRFDDLERRMEEGFRNVQTSIDRVGRR